MRGNNIANGHAGQDQRMTLGATRVLAFGAIYGGPAILIPAIILALLVFWLTQRRSR